MTSGSRVRKQILEGRKVRTECDKAREGISETKSEQWDELKAVHYEVRVMGWSKGSEMMKQEYQSVDDNFPWVHYPAGTKRFHKPTSNNLRQTVYKER